jgi:hypothetical protein
LRGRYLFEKRLSSPRSIFQKSFSGIAFIVNDKSNSNFFINLKLPIFSSNNEKTRSKHHFETAYLSILSVIIPFPEPLSFFQKSEILEFTVIYRLLPSEAKGA